MSIDVRQAVEKAQKHLELLQDLLGVIEEVRLEETELSKNKKFWLITLGYNVPINKDKNSVFSEQILGIQHPRYQREYKTFQINKETGEVESMKIRQL